MVEDNGGSLIERTGPKILQQITITLIEVSPGVTATNLSHNITDEIACRGLFDKGRVVLDKYWADQNAPKVVPLTDFRIPPAIRQLRG